MSDTWLLTLGSVAVVSLISLIGALSLGGHSTFLTRGLLFLVSFAAGALLGDAFLHLLPEVTEGEGGFDVAISLSVLGGIVGFFLLEKVLHWHHAHFPNESEEVLHPVAVTNLVGDALHNLLDGVAVAAGFIISPEAGFATTIAVALHEIPQELGDFGILVHAGMAPRRALTFNFLSGLMAVVGAVVTLSVASAAETISDALVPVIAGSFIYIGSTDLLPELHKEPEARKSAVQFVGLLGGIGVMVALLGLE